MSLMGKFESPRTPHIPACLGVEPGPLQNLRAGQKVTVMVENVFEGGMVVCYHNRASNVVAKGALLGIPTSTPMLMSSSCESSLANPQSFQHDHHYDDSPGSEPVPKSILDHWDSPSKLNPSTLKAVGERKPRLSHQLLSCKTHRDPSQFSKWRAGERCVRGVVEIPLPRSLLSPNSSTRLAKLVASQKIKEDLRYMTPSRQSKGRGQGAAKVKEHRLENGFTSNSCSRARNYHHRKSKESSSSPAFYKDSSPPSSICSSSSASTSGSSSLSSPSPSSPPPSSPSPIPSSHMLMPYSPSPHPSSPASPSPSSLSLFSDVELEIHTTPSMSNGVQLPADSSLINQCSTAGKPIVRDFSIKLTKLNGHVMTGSGSLSRHMTSDSDIIIID